MAARIWRQEIINWGDVATLRLWHPDGRTETHRFEPDVIDQVKKLTWSPVSGGYAQARVPGAGEMTRLHWIVLGLQGGNGFSHQVDHMNHDTRDNRRVNLHYGSGRENQQNKITQSQYGVNIRRAEKDGGYVVSIQIADQKTYQPWFESLGLATTYRDKILKLIEDGNAPTYDEQVTIRDARNYKISPEQALDVRQRFIRGSRWNPGNAQALADEFNVTRQCIYQIVNGKRDY